MANGPVLVVDFGAQYAQLIARRVREAGVYSELVPHSMPVDEILAKDPKAIILSGGPASVFEPGAPTIDTKVFESGVPVLGICYGFQVMAYELGGKVDKAALGEYGKTSATIDDAAGILADSPAEQTTWMSHGVAVEQAPAGFEVLAHTEGAPVAAMADESRKLYGVQWHPEVKHSPLGQKLIENFLHRCAALPNDWDASSIIEDQVKKIREQVGDAEVICGLSGGVDSAVAAALVHKAIGDQLTCVFVDHGLLRKGEVEQVKHDFVAATGIRLITVDAADDFLDALAGVSEPERKAFNAIIDTRFTDVVRPYTPGPGVYTYWDYTQLAFQKRRGMRIDFILGSPGLARRVVHAEIVKDERRPGKKGDPSPSDHAPVLVDLRR